MEALQEVLMLQLCFFSPFLCFFFIVVVLLWKVQVLMQHTQKGPLKWLMTHEKQNTGRPDIAFQGALH